MKRSNRLGWLGAIALAVIILVTLIAAPTTSHLNNGSTYSRAPDGYGAWYTFMQQRGTPVQRWQRPFSDLLREESPITLLRVNSQLTPLVLQQNERDWVEKGNTLVILGLQAPVTEATFSTIQHSSADGVKVDTRRRQDLKDKKRQLSLGDRFGAVVWEVKQGRGRLIFSTTPHLAANAYQDAPGNYTYLAQILSKDGSLILVDEYMHGYKDSAVRKSEAERNWVRYLAQTPLLPTILQSAILLLVLIWAKNQRFGQPVALNATSVDNSGAYIQALAGVLQKAECSEFVVDVLGKEEQLQLQKALGLGQAPLDRQTLVNTWVQQTGQSAAELEYLLQSQKRRMSEKDLLNWLGEWQNIRRQLPFSRK